jgi:hypothetical protein
MFIRGRNAETRTVSAIKYTACYALGFHFSMPDVICIDYWVNTFELIEIFIFIVFPPVKIRLRYDAIGLIIIIQNPF